MQFSTSIVLAALVSLVSAQANAFTLGATTLSQGLTAGNSVNITWIPTSPGTVTLLLKQGSPSDLSTVSTIASGAPNSGSFIWTPSTNLVKASDYALEIVDDTNTNSVNFSGEFPIDSSVTVSASTQSTTSTSTTSASSTTDSSSTTASSTGTTTTTGSSSTSSNITLSSQSSSTGSSSRNSSATIATKTISGTSSATSASASQTTTIASGSGMRFKVGGSMLALVGAVMVAL